MCTHRGSKLWIFRAQVRAQCASAERGPKSIQRRDCEQNQPIPSFGFLRRKTWDEGNRGARRRIGLLSRRGINRCKLDLGPRGQGWANHLCSPTANPIRAQGGNLVSGPRRREVLIVPGRAKFGGAAGLSPSPKAPRRGRRKRGLSLKARRMICDQSLSLKSPPSDRPSRNPHKRPKTSLLQPLLWHWALCTGIPKEYRPKL